MLKHQEQVLSRDLGLAGDLLYHSSSYANVPPSDTRYVGLGDFNLAYPLYFKGMGLRASTVAGIPATLGYQVFDSTTNPVPKFNYCRNQKLRLVCHPVGNWQWYRDFPKYSTCSGAPYYRYGLPTGTLVPTIPEIIDWSLSDSASSRAWWTMQPRFQGEFDGLNFLFELKDFKSIAKGLSALRPSKIAETLKRAKSSIRRAQRQVEQGTATARAHQIAASASRVAAEAVLIKSFAIDPTVRDLVTLYSQLQNLVSDVQHQFRDKGETLNRRHYGEEISRVDTTQAYTGGNSCYKKGLFKVDKFIATMEFTYDYKMRDKVDAMKRYYGGELTAGVVWNAIPFSFLIDYVCTIGDAIDNMTTDPNVVTTMSQYCESRCVTIKSGMMFNSACAQRYNWVTIINGKPAASDQIITGYEGSLYERRVVPPRKGMALPRIKLPSVKQALNIAALVRCFWG